MIRMGKAVSIGWIAMEMDMMTVKMVFGQKKSFDN
ncbi:hypothetical protein EVA_03357 [gut metagenome]|uniref:Uncharacterized protein n=1 Tax=gut metagenome TaxID=749906 RepID=J9GL37_9ZZZZ